ncbi:MAG: glycosyltransferase family 39 protein [Candidatus Nanopelagicales bacterium]
MTASRDVETLRSEPSADLPATRRAWLVPAILLVITVVGFAFRWAGMDESFYGDELFTYQIATSDSLRGALSMVRSDLEITPPLFFVLAWGLQHLGDPFLWLRATSLVAGTATIPLTYLLGARTVSRRAGLVAAALMALSPLGIFYSSEARAYALMTVLVLLSTLVLLRALDSSGWVWWVVLAGLYTAAMYSHYTAAFVLLAQAAWALWTRRDRWLPLVLSMGGAALLFLPWLPAFLADGKAPPQKIIGILVPFSPGAFTGQTARLLMGSIFARLENVPGLWAAALFTVGLLLGLVGWFVAARPRRPHRLTARHALVVVIALAAPLGAAGYSLVSDDMFLARNLLSSLPALYVVIGAVLVAGSRRVVIVAVALAVAGMGWAAVQTLNPDNQRPQNREAAEYIVARAAPGDTVLQILPVVGPPATALDVHLPETLRGVHVRPGVTDPPGWQPPTGTVFGVGSTGDLAQLRDLLPPGYRETASQTWEGGRYSGVLEGERLTVYTFEPGSP